MGCSDPYLTHLKRFGYNVVLLPKTDVRPGQLLARNGKDLTRLGDLGGLFSAGPEPLPPVIGDQRVANLSGQQTGELSIGIGLSLLGTIIGALGGSKLGLDLKYERARTAVFQFEDVLEDRMELLKLDAFLGGADVSSRAPHVRDLLFADEVYVTTATIKSTRFTVEAKDSSKKGLELSVPEIKQVVGGSVKVSGSGEKTSKVTYEGAIPLVFGFQAVRLDYDGGRYRRFQGLKAGEVALEAIRPTREVPDPQSAWLESPGAFLRLHDQ